jgi:hypothetical protein
MTLKQFWMKLTESEESRILRERSEREAKWMEIYQYWKEMNKSEITPWRSRILTAAHFGCSEAKVTTSISYAIKFEKNKC